MMDSKAISTSPFSATQCSEAKQVRYRKSLSFWIDLLVKLIAISFFIISLSHVLRAADIDHNDEFDTYPDREEVIKVHTEDFLQETSK